MTVPRAEKNLGDPASLENVDVSAGSDRLQPKTGLEYHVARSLADVRDAWHLVHQSYVRHGLIDPNKHELHAVPEAIGPHAAVVLGRIGPVCASTLTAFTDQAQGLALDHAYPDELEALRAAGRRLCEVGLFADRRQHLYRSAASLFDLMRFSVLYAMHQQMDDVVIGVHPRHAPFYRRLIGFKPAGPEKTYATVNDNAVVLLRLDLHEAPNRRPLPRGLRYFLEHPVSDEAFEQRVRLTPDTIRGTPLEAFTAAKSEPARARA